jgi:hypothetical protein
MTEMLTDLRFCHLVGVTDTDEFYRDLLGMNVVLYQRISGESFNAALNSARAQQGRVVGGRPCGVTAMSWRRADLIRRRRR